MTGLDLANIASGLTAMAHDRPDALAVLAPAGRDPAGRAKHVHWTFRQLDRQSDFVAAGLIEQGIGRGIRAVPRCVAAPEAPAQDVSNSNEQRFREMATRAQQCR